MNVKSAVNFVRSEREDKREKEDSSQIVLVLGENIKILMQEIGEVQSLRNFAQHKKCDQK